MGSVSIVGLREYKEYLEKQISNLEKLGIYTGQMDIYKYELNRVREMLNLVNNEEVKEIWERIKQ